MRRGARTARLPARERQAKIVQISPRTKQPTEYYYRGGSETLQIPPFWVDFPMNDSPHVPPPAIVPLAPAVAIIGGGPADVMGAETLSLGGVHVEVYDTMPSPGRRRRLQDRIEALEGCRSWHRRMPTARSTQGIVTLPAPGTALQDSAEVRRQYSLMRHRTPSGVCTHAAKAPLDFLSFPWQTQFLGKLIQPRERRRSGNDLIAS
jgi:hypothetical protein